MIGRRLAVEALRAGEQARERRIPHHRIEARVLPLEHIRELDLPMEGRERRVGVAP